MSQDQRPGRVRVISSGTSADMPQRRRTDARPLPATPRNAAPDEARTAATPFSWRTTIMSALLFLCGCAIGGVIVAVYGLPRLLGR